jgi:hypothetical protein
MSRRWIDAMIPWIVVPIGSIVYAVWWFMALCANGSHHEVTQLVWNEWVLRSLLPNGPDLLHATSLFYAITGMLVIASTLLFFTEPENGDYRKSDGGLSGVVGSIGLILVVACTLGFITGISDNAKDEGRGYASSTTFVVPPGTEPTALKALFDTKKNGDDKNCKWIGTHDVPSCIIEGAAPSSWTPRVASFTGAQLVLKKTSDGGASNTQFMDQSTTYLYGPGGTGKWTGIRTGKNNQPLRSVAEWDGIHAATTECKFEGPFALKRAFGGKWGNNLNDLLAKRYPTLFYSEDDLWGYCQNSDKKDAKGIALREPIVVVPVTRQIGLGQRTVLRPAGVLIIRGDNGTINIQHKTSVKPGELPGPVYAMSLAAKQRDMIQWAAGEKRRNRSGFGYDLSTNASQAGNLSEYLLRAPDGRLYWVTPLTPRSSDADNFTALSVTPADMVSDGQLNTQLVYALPDDDRHIVKLDDLRSRVNNAMKEENPAFFTGNDADRGEIVEFLPISATTWQAFGLQNGRVRYLIKVPIDNSLAPGDPVLKPTITDLDAAAAASKAVPTDGKPVISACMVEPKTMTRRQALDCLQELSSRLNMLEQTKK